MQPLIRQSVGDSAFIHHPGDGVISVSEDMLVISHGRSSDYIFDKWYA
jgi:hypothetical protein